MAQPEPGRRPHGEGPDSPDRQVAATRPGVRPRFHPDPTATVHRARIATFIPWIKSEGPRSKPRLLEAESPGPLTRKGSDKLPGPSPRTPTTVTYWDLTEYEPDR